MRPKVPEKGFHSCSTKGFIKIEDAVLKGFVRKIQTDKFMNPLKAKLRNENKAKLFNKIQTNTEKNKNKLENYLNSIIIENSPTNNSQLIGIIH